VDAELFQDGPEGAGFDFGGGMARDLGDEAIVEDLGVARTFFESASQFAKLALQFARGQYLV
jgi:hypothetical protein